MPEIDLAWKNIMVGGRPTATFCFFADRNGIIWLGSNNGLWVFDGVNTHKINHEKLEGSQVYALIEYSGFLFVGTNQGLFTLKYNDGIIEIIDNKSPKEIRCLTLVDKQLWLGSLYGVFTADLLSTDLDDGLTIESTTGLPHKSTYSIMRDSRGIIYAGTFNGLAKWDNVKNRFISISTRPFNESHHNLFVNCLLESNDCNFLYVGSEGALYKYYIAEDKWEDIPELTGNNIKSLARINDNHIMIGTDNGVYDFHLDSLKHYKHDTRQNSTIADNEIWCLHADADNNILAGHERGFSISSHSNIIRNLRLSSLTGSGEGNEIHCIFRDSKDNLWLGGTNGVLQLSKDRRTNWHRHNNKNKALSHNRIRAIKEDSQGSLWLSTDGGLNRFNYETNQFDVFHVVDSTGNHNTNWVYAFEEDSVLNSFWIGGFLSGLHRVSIHKFSSSGGIVYSDMSLNSDKTDSLEACRHLENDLVNNVVIDKEGQIWILLFRDDILACYNPKTDSMARYNIYELSGCYPSNLSKDNRGRIWCTFNGGAVIFQDNNYQILRFSNPTEDENVLSLGPVGDDMWVSTNSKLWKINGDNLSATILPIPQKAYTAVYEDIASNKVLLGGVDEILEVSPHAFNNKSDLKIKNVAMVWYNTDRTSMQQFNLHNTEKSITIPYGGSVSLIFSALDYSPTSVQRYMYNLCDAKSDTTEGWQVLPEGINRISFSDLKMGHFNILIKRVGIDDIPVSIPLDVEPPLLLSWWAILIYIFTGIIVVFVAVSYVKRKNERFYQEEERRKALDNVEKKLTFLSNISHDLKTPLSMIIGPVSLMKESNKDPETKKTLETIYENAMRLNNLIHKTIELHHLEDGDDSMLILSTFEIVEFCRGVFETFKENHPEKKFVFHSSCPEIFIEGDAVKFESVMTNLLSNACKYSEEGATISCGISRQDDIAEIVVSDDGLGIEDIDQPLVFQRMFRAPSTAKLYEGTGLGLYLIKKYLELMKGNIDLYSKKGQGTSFIITLPTTEKKTGEKTSQLSKTAYDKPKILIVDDNEQISSFISTLLGEEYMVLVADNGRAGLAIASSFAPDLVIADEMMPIMNGLEMCRRMRQNPRLVSVPIIMLTAKTDNQTENESVKLGIDSFMPKPFDPKMLLGRVKQLLKSRSDIRQKLRLQVITEAKPIEAESSTEKQLNKIARIIEENISDPDLNVNFLCEKSGIPQKQLYRLIKKYLDTAPLDYIRRVRLQKAAMLLSQKRFTVSEISYMVGFKTPSYFAKCFQAHYGVKPSQYKSDDDNTISNE